LQARYADLDWVRCFNMTSVGIMDFPAADDVAAFYENHPTSPLRQSPLDEILRWLHQDIEYVERDPKPQNGIRAIKEQSKIDLFDLVLIDGSEFTGSAELQELYGAKHILLDDIRTFKNFANYERLRRDPAYAVLAENPECRNGFAAFRLTTAPLVDLLSPRISLIA